MDEAAVRIPADQLRAVLDLLLRHLEQVSDGDLSVTRDYFWSIPGDQVYDVLNEPSELTVGQIAESWSNLQGILEDPAKAIGFGLVWLADVLRALGHETVG